MKPLAIDLFCGLGGWAEGFLAEGWNIIGFDIERHDYGTGGYPGQMVLQDVTTLHGSQFKYAACIVASPPCQAYSYRAMPWKRAKALPPPDNTLFEMCFRIQMEACEAAGRFIPLIVENVRGAQKWVGQANWKFGSFYLWGDIPCLMPIGRPIKMGKAPKKKNGKTIRMTCPEEWEWANTDGGFKGFAARFRDSPMAQFSSRDRARKAASAKIAKIPFPLAQHIARVFKPIGPRIEPPKE